MIQRLVLPSLICLVVLLCACAPAGGIAPDREDATDVLTVDARVVRLEIEGGFFGLIADSGQRYDPGRLPEEFCRDGLKVRALLRPLPGMVTTRMWGRRVELIGIEHR